MSAEGFAPLRALGIISGTSMDGIDLALVETDGAAHVRPLAGATLPWPEAVHAPLLAVVEQARAQGRDPGPCTALEAALTDAFADAVRAFLSSHNGPAPDLIGLHGQTVWHRPEAGVTRQLGDGARLARALGVPVVDGFRLADVAAGGQGAPLAPLFHAALAGGLARPLAVLNLGGVGNVTWLGAGGEVVAFDTGPGSAAMDDLVRARLGQPFDRDGALAASGRVDTALVGAVLGSSFFSEMPPKSLDRNDFHAALAPISGIPDTADALATLAAVTVAAAAAARAHFPAPAIRWLVCGGGRGNSHLMNGLRDILQVPVEAVEAVGWNGDLLEAECFGYLAVRSLRGLPLSLPGTTGVPRPMPGGRRHDPARPPPMAAPELAPPALMAFDGRRPNKLPERAMTHIATTRIGAFQVTMLTDGARSFPPDLFPGAAPETVQALLSAAGESEIRTNFNAMLVQGAGRTVLVDAGCRDLLGDAAGRMPAALAEAGCSPAEVQVLFVSHIHPDHIGGTVTPEGAAAFPTAELVVPEAEIAFWSDPARGENDATAKLYGLAQQMFAAYAGRLRPLPEGGAIAPGLTAVPLPGHTPGHSGVRLESEGAVLVNIVDIVHAQHLQLPDPDIGIAFDGDPDTARETRHRMLAEAAEAGFVVTGGHLLQPALGRIERAGTGYRLVPLD